MSEQECCPGGECGPVDLSIGGSGGSVSRRGFLALGGAGATTAVFATRAEAAQALGVPEDCVVLVPPDKGLSKEWIASLYRRGTPTVSSGPDLTFIGMPVGGGCCGEVYLGGDGQLWRWDVINSAAKSTSDRAYIDPARQSAPFRQGFLLRVGRKIWSLDAAGFDDVRFTGRYPVGRVDYRTPGCPVEVTLEAFSPFVPLATDDSTLPATVLVYTLRNTSARPVTAEVLGFAETPVALNSRHTRPITLRAGSFRAGATRGLQFSAVEGTTVGTDIVFEDWEGTGFDGWTVTGTAFGSGPVAVTDLPSGFTRFGDLNVRGRKFVTSYATGADTATGSLTSKQFTIERSHITLRVGGGNHPGQTGVNVLVDGAVVASATGTDTEPLVPVALDVSAHRGKTATIRIVDTATGAWGHVNADAILFTDRPDIVFENWEKTTYEGWTVTGTAFGSGPVTVDEVPDLMKRFGGFNALGQRFVTSYDYRGNPSAPDTSKGTLTSASFTIDRRYLVVRVGGGDHAGQTCLNLMVDGKAVVSAVGADAEPMTIQAFDVSAYQGKTATIQIVDDNTEGWGHVNVDTILFTDRGLDGTPLSEVPDNGTFGLAALDAHAVVTPSIADPSTARGLFASQPGPTQVDARDGTITGTVRVPVSLAPGRSHQLRFLYGWYFPVPDRLSLGFLTDSVSLRRHYATRFDSAQQVVTHVADDLDRLEADTRLWAKTFYDDSTLPHWFLERTFATASTVATSTCYRFDSGRFYGWEGVYCCAGTCEHVWNYAHSIARLFPELERDTRERVDLGIGFHADTGEIGNRAEADPVWATDGECGTILRIYREHQMAPDSSFLTKNWPHIKLALQFVISHDAGSDGTIDGPQPNTLDAVWYGEIAWISGMYVAALQAGAAMADEVGDGTFAHTCRRLAARGTQILSTTLWTGEYFIQKIDPAHKDVVNSNIGCHIDQMFGQSTAGQLGLPRAFDAAQSRTALRNIYKYNFAPDPADYRARNTDIKGARIYAEAHEPGVLMTTWPHCGAATAAGDPPSGVAIYFNECWTGQEYQLAAQMLYDDVVDEGLIVTRAVHDRYAAAKRNPYNEIECGEHYARAMAGYGVYLGACGFTHHGPAGRIGFAPAWSPEHFAAAFTANTGWGLYRQQRDGHTQTSTIEVRYGKLAVESISLRSSARVKRATVQIGRQTVRPTITTHGDTVEVQLPKRVTVPAGTTLTVELAT